MHKREIRGLLCSMLLGDGWLQSRNGVFGMQHSVKQEDYLLWKADLINNVFIDKKLPKRCTLTKHRNKVKGIYYDSIRATFQWKKYLKPFLYPKAYRNEKKYIQYLLEQIYNPIHLAIWFMDDGGERTKVLRNGDFCPPHYRLFIYDFTEGQVNFSKEWFKYKYKIEPKILLHKKEKPYFSFSVDESKEIFKICYPYFKELDSMKNKFKGSFQRFNLEIEDTPEKGENIVQANS